MVRHGGGGGGSRLFPRSRQVLLLDGDVSGPLEFLHPLLRNNRERSFKTAATLTVASGMGAARASASASASGVTCSATVDEGPAGPAACLEAARRRFAWCCAVACAEGSAGYMRVAAVRLRLEDVSTASL